MSVEIKVPVLPESVADAVIASWYKQPGDTVQQDETLVDLETDKVILEVPALSSGVLKEIRYQVGDTVTANQILAVIDEAAVKNNSPSAKAAGVTTAVNSHAAEESGPAISPSAKKMMAEQGLAAADIQGSGKHGRVLKQDVIAASAQRVPMTAAPKNAAVKPAPASSDSTTAAVPAFGRRIEKRVPMSRLRARIAERLVRAQSDAAILTTFNEVNMQPLMEMRKRYRDRFEKNFGVRLGYMSLFVKAAVEALKQSPVMNASVDGNDIVYHGYFDIGIAVSGQNGLVVPVLRDADQMSIAEIEQAIADFASRAKTNALNIEELTGGTFTITNGGVFGSMLSTPILNPPQAAILGMHNIKERAMVVDGNIVALPMMYLALSYDHRLIDGREAVRFLVVIRDFLEDPTRMILGL